jgi:hemerythrin-like domain-containing protein
MKRFIVHAVSVLADYEVFAAIIEFFKMYPDSCHHPKEDIIYEKFKARDPDRAASIADLKAEHRKVCSFHPQAQYRSGFQQSYYATL